MKNVQYYLPVINNLTVYSIRWVPPVLCRCKHRALRNVYVGDEIKYSKNQFCLLLVYKMVLNIVLNYYSQDNR